MSEEEDDVMVTVTMPRDSWRVIHGGLLELSALWGMGVTVAGRAPAERQQIEDVMQKVLPPVSVASKWPEVAQFETETRADLGLPVPEDALEAGRALVRELPPEEW